MNIKRKALKALDKAFFYAGSFYSIIHKPGAVINRLSPEDRKDLENLKSDDIKKVWIFK